MPDALISYSLIFSRIVIGLVFVASSLGKIRSFSAFEQAVENFQILPPQFVRACAAVFLGSELVIVVMMFWGGKSLLMIGFLIALILLSVFCIALLAVLIRRLQVPCNCFGSSQRPASSADIWRNVGLITCALMGIAALPALPDATTNISPLETGLLGMMALVFVALSIYLREVIEVFHVS